MKIAQKYAVLICLVISFIFMLIATLVYPGGSIIDKNSVGFRWSENFFSNLFAATAINGSVNTSRIWAIIGIAFHSIGYGIFFINTSKKMPINQAAKVLKFTGISNILFSFLIATALHDLMIIVSSTLFLLGLFYITIFTIKSKHNILKFSCIICMLIYYFTLYLYGLGNWGLLAIMQKVSFISSMLLVVGLEYFSRKEHFQPINNA